MPRPVALPREHGSPRGYFQHINRGEYACTPCRLARTTLPWAVAQWIEFERLRGLGVSPEAAAVLAAMLHVGRRRAAREVA